MIVLDTSAIIDFLRKGEKTRRIIERENNRGDMVGITSISLFELLTPIFHRRLLKREKGVRAFARESLFLGLDAAATDEAAKIMGSLLRIGKRVNALDVLISGIAVANGANEIVTSDKDFQTIQKVANIDIVTI
ncbi:type II toxin-antitoxin system VapC family toxin [Candidatus Bathyarchaeota archaeon]|nr:MAG: type II toxin-antitoxin system VapC family toxin [Candidatus Bathyarchaeota archaeon]